MIYWRYLFILGATLLSQNLKAEELKIMSWNIANLAADAGKALRDGSHIRTEDDFGVIRAIIGKADADILALQEVGSLAAAKNILGSGYKVVLESRCLEETCELDHGEIYTAIAWKSNLPIQKLTIVQVKDLAVPHVSDCTFHETRKVRGGVGISFQHNDQPTIVLSVHLKASCADERSHDPVNRPAIQDDCAVLDEQFHILSKWIKAQSQSGKTVIVAGDYNRKLLLEDDRYKKLLLSENPDLRIEPSVASQCWPKNYPQSRNYRIKLAKKAFAAVEGNYRWEPYMPSSIRTRDFFLIAGGTKEKLSEADEILMRPEKLVYDPKEKLSAQQWIALEKQAEQVGVRMGAPNGYIEACTAENNDPTNTTPTPQPFVGGNTVLSFAPIYPSDHCPITIALN